jgi:AraC-like DNA-binding protein
MGYRQFDPHPSLSSLIDAYWTSTSSETSLVSDRIMPDGCIDIILNLGTDFLSENGTFTMKHEAAYLVGTMTRYKDVIRQAGTSLVGIRFKPGAFSSFYKFSALHEVANTAIEFEQNLAPAITPDTVQINTALDHFFYKRITETSPALQQVMHEINLSKGRIAVSALAKQCAMSNRKLERIFNLHTGISPKEFINFVRYQNAFSQIENRHNPKSLADIAFDCGYYDHAHLTNEVKKYTGVVPSRL